MFKNTYIATILYHAAIDEEKEWRAVASKQDILTLERLMFELKAAGYSYKYFSDITNRNNTEKNFLKIIEKYVGLFEDKGVTAELIGVIGQKGNKKAVNTILNSFKELSDEEKQKHAIFYDNALEKTKSKEYVSHYLELLKQPNDAIKLPLTMIVLGKWKIEDAKPYFFEYLNSTLFYINKNTSDLVYTAIEALSYYADCDGTIKKTLEKKLLSDDKDLVLATKKALKRLKQQ